MKTDLQVRGDGGPKRPGGELGADCKLKTFFEVDNPLQIFQSVSVDELDEAPDVGHPLINVGEVLFLTADTAEKCNSGHKDREREIKRSG
jgi:hypothetical protein